MIKRTVLSVVALMQGQAVSAASHDDVVERYALAEVLTYIADDARIDWNAKGTASYELQNDFIRQMFLNGAREGAAAHLVGEQPSRLEIEVVEFDILSDLEKFFCCAKNEVSDYLTLRDAQTGEVLLPRSLVTFDHVGRGGFFAAISAVGGEDQITRLIGIIRESTEEWIVEPF